MVQPRTASLTLVILSTLLSACGRHDVHEESLVEQVPEALLVDVGSGDVSIFGADVSEVSVTAKVQGPSNHVGQMVDQGRLTLFDDCSEEPCSVDLSVRVPGWVTLNLRTGSGDVRLENIGADVALKTGSGDVTGWQLSGLDLSAETGSGDVAFELVTRANRVHVRAGSGDVALTVPSGSYRIDVSSGSGDRRFEGVSDEANAASALDVSTGSGDVSIRGR